MTEQKSDRNRGSALVGMLGLLLFFALLGCEIKFDYEVDGKKHQFVVNPDSEEEKP